MSTKKSIFAAIFALITALLLRFSVADGLAQSDGLFVPTGAMTTPRFSHTATLLRDGRVLITGGSQTDIRTCLKSAEIYDPATGAFAATGDMLAARTFHSAVLLPDDRVLIVGGCNGMVSADLYDPATGTFAAAGDIFSARWGLSSTLLKDGRVLFSRGVINNVPGPPAAPYDPATNTFTATGDWANGSYSSTANLLGDGTVLIVGGWRKAYPWLYEPTIDAFVQLDSAPWPSLIYHSATSLANGKVLIAGGASDDYGFDASAQATLYDPASGNFQTITPLLRARDFHTATLLKDGRVLITGGYNEIDANSGILSDAELYDPSTDSFTYAGGMNKGRESHTATLLNDGRVLIAGGLVANGRWPPNPNDASAELFVPTSTNGQVPALSLDQSRYCTGNAWRLQIAGAPAISSIRLMGISQGTPWELRHWRNVDQDGALSESGTFGADAIGDHTLWAVAGGKTSNSLNFRITPCAN